MWVNRLSTKWMTIKITTTLFTLTVWTCTAITCCTTGLTIHWDVSSRTTFFAFRLSHFVLIETSWKLEISSLRFECLDGSLFRKTPAHCTLWGDSGWRTWALPLWKCVTWISIAHNLTSAISRPSSSKSTPNYFHVAAALSPNIIYGPHSDCQKQLYFTGPFPA